jgi:hypothetical protein
MIKRFSTHIAVIAAALAVLTHCAVAQNAPKTPQASKKKGDAFQATSDEEGSPQFAEAPRIDPQLVSRRGKDLGWDHGGIQQQGKTGDQKIVRVSREYETIELALFHQLGALPEPQFTHEFC